MEFAITGPILQIDSDDSWQPSGSRSFLFKWVAGYSLVRPDGLRIGAALRIALIAIFGAIGTLARYGLQGVVQIRLGSTFPYGTLLVNLTGCFLLGLIGQFTMNRLVISPDWRVAIAVGFFGGYTTFSSFGWETAKLLEEGAWL